MVLAERNSELVRNGRRSRGPSPNGHGASSGSASASAPGGTGTGTPETSSDDDNCKFHNILYISFKLSFMAVIFFSYQTQWKI